VWHSSLVFHLVQINPLTILIGAFIILILF
jgi:hypothetical protein